MYIIHVYHIYIYTHVYVHKALFSSWLQVTKRRGRKQKNARSNTCRWGNGGDNDGDNDGDNFVMI